MQDKSTLARAIADTDPALVCAARELLVALEAIAEEASGTSKPYSSDSYLPPQFITTARAAIANARNDLVGMWNAIPAAERAELAREFSRGFAEQTRGQS